jgi:AmmeMemoRadiSam system protein A
VTSTSSSGTPRLSPHDRETLLRLARQTLTDYLGKGELSPLPTDSPALLESRATFVTLRVRTSGDLRGCRGETRARRPLAESVRLMAIASAVDDPRFPPVTLAEVPDLRLEINVLTPLAPIRVEEIEVGRHGLMIEYASRAGLLLPDVPTSFGWDRDTFLRMLCRKAGLPDDAWRDRSARLLGFECEAWGEEE